MTRIIIRMLDANLDVACDVEDGEFFGMSREDVWQRIYLPLHITALKAAESTKPASAVGDPDA